jgi:hypothetical protein
VGLASPYRVVAGEPELADRFTARSPIQRTEMGLDVHPVERAFDDLKEVIRTHRQRLLQTPTSDHHQEGVAPSSGAVNPQLLAIALLLSTTSPIRHSLSVAARASGLTIASMMLAAYRRYLVW